MRRSLAVLVVLGAFLLVSPPVSATGQERTRVVAACQHVDYQPAHYIFFCADGGAGLRHATYDAWKTWSARGTATYYYNDCDPSCAGGTWHNRAATFRLYRVVDTAKHGPLFTRIKVMTTKRNYVYQLPTRPY